MEFAGGNGVRRLGDGRDSNSAGWVLGKSCAGRADCDRGRVAIQDATVAQAAATKKIGFNKANSVFKKSHM